MTAPYGWYPHPQPGQFAPTGPVQPPATPARPVGVVVAAVVGLLIGVGAAFLTVALCVEVGNALHIAATAPEASGRKLLAQVGVVLLPVAALLSAGYAVLAVWGSVLALTGRNYAALVTAASMTLFVSGMGVITDVRERAVGPATAIALLIVVTTLLAVVLLRRPGAARFFAAHRAARAYRR